jgi:hypothetical protein
MKRPGAAPTWLIKRRRNEILKATAAGRLANVEAECAAQISAAAQTYAGVCGVPLTADEQVVLAVLVYGRIADEIVAEFNAALSGKGR